MKLLILSEDHFSAFPQTSLYLNTKEMLGLSKKTDYAGLKIVNILWTTSLSSTYVALCIRLSFDLQSPLKESYLGMLLRQRTKCGNHMKI